MFKKLIVIALIVLLIFSINVGVSAEEKLIQDWTSSIIRVVQFDTSGTWLAHGTGFPIGLKQPVEYFITNQHVIDGKGKKVDIRVLLGKDDYVDAKVIVALPIADVAIIKTKDKLYGIDPFIINEENVEVGEFVYALGFPGDAIAASYEDSYKEDVTITKGIIGKDTITKDGIEVYRTDTAINGGNSGGPLLNEAGHVLGINSFGYSSAIKLDINGIVKILYATDILNSRGIKYLSSKDVVALEKEEVVEDNVQVESTPEPKQEATPEPKVESTPAPKVESTPEPVETPVIVQVEDNHKGGINSSVLIAIGIAALLLVISTSLVLLGKKKTYKNRARAFISGAGIITPFEITIKPCLIGREGTLCNIVNSDGSVSRKHASISYKNGQFILVDVSSGGTFLADGTRLEQSKPYILNNGDSFYLVNEDNMYQVSETR